jgi:hypothetical protein
MTNRTNWSLWPKGHLDQLRTRQEDVVADGTNREGSREEDYADRDQ